MESKVISDRFAAPGLIGTWWFSKEGGRILWNTNVEVNFHHNENFKDRKLLKGDDM